MMIKVKYILCCFSFTFFFNLYSQRVENVDFVVKDNNIIVTYDLIDCKPKQLYDIELSVICGGEKILPKSITGDISKISCGKRKVIEWNVLNDKSELKGNTQVIVVISKTYSTKISGGPSNAFLSMLLPGWGDYFVNREGKSYYYVPLLFFGSAYYAYSTKMQSNSYYKQYHLATTQSEMDATYKLANDKYQVFQLLVGLTATIWVVDVLYVTIKGFKNRREQMNSIAFNQRKPKFFIMASTNSFGLGLTKKF